MYTATCRRSIPLLPPIREQAPSCNSLHCVVAKFLPVLAVVRVCPRDAPTPAAVSFAAACKKTSADAGATTAPSIAAAKAKIAAQRPPLPFNNRKILISIPQRISTQNLLHYTQKSQNCKIPTPKPKFYKFPPPPPEKNKSGGMIWLRNGIVRLRNKIKKLRKKTQRLRNRMQRLRKKSVRLRNQTKKLRKKTQRLRNRMQWLRNKMKKLRNGIVRLRNKTKKSEKPLILQQKYFRRLSFRR